MASRDVSLAGTPAGKFAVNRNRNNAGCRVPAPILRCGGVDRQPPYASTTIGCISVPAIRLAIASSSAGPVKTFISGAPEYSGRFTCIPLRSRPAPVRPPSPMASQAAAVPRMRHPRLDLSCWPARAARPSPIACASATPPACVRRSVARCAPHPASAPTCVRRRPHVPTRRHLHLKPRPGRPPTDSNSKRDGSRSAPTSISTGVPHHASLYTGPPPILLRGKHEGICFPVLAVEARRQPAQFLQIPPHGSNLTRRPALRIESIGRKSKPDRPLVPLIPAGAEENCARRVYLPSSSGNTPVAIGSRRIGVPEPSLRPSPAAQYPPLVSRSCPEPNQGRNPFIVSSDYAVLTTRTAPPISSQWVCSCFERGRASARRSVPRQ